MATLYVGCGGGGDTALAAMVAMASGKANVAATGAAESVETIRKHVSEQHIHAKTAAGEHIRESLRFNRGFHRQGLSSYDADTYLSKIVEEKDCFRAKVRTDFDEEDFETARLVAGVNSTELGRPTEYNSMLDEARFATFGKHIEMSIFTSLGGCGTKYSDWKGCYQKWTPLLVRHAIAITAAALLRECDEHNANELVLVDMGGDIVRHVGPHFSNIMDLSRDELVLYAGALLASMRPKLRVRVVVYGPGVDAQVEMGVAMSPRAIEARLVAAGFVTDIMNNRAATLSAFIEHNSASLPSTLLSETRATAIFKRLQSMSETDVTEATALLAARNPHWTAASLTSSDIVAAQQVYVLELHGDSAVNELFGEAETTAARQLGMVVASITDGESSQYMKAVLARVPATDQDVSLLLAMALKAQDQLRALVRDGVLPEQGVVSKADPSKITFGDQIPIVSDGKFLEKSGWVCQMPRRAPYIALNIGPNVVFCDRQSDVAERRINMYHDDKAATLAMARAVVAHVDDPGESLVLLKCLIVMLALNKKEITAVIRNRGESVYRTVADSFEEIWRQLNFSTECQPLAKLYREILTNEPKTVRWLVMCQSWRKDGSAMHSIPAPHFQCLLSLPPDRKYDVHHVWLAHAGMAMHESKYKGTFIDVRGWIDARRYD